MSLLVIILSALMSPFNAPLLADVFDRFRIQLSDGIVNWLTPVWILCVGAAAGLLLCSLFWGILRLIALIPGVAALADKRESRYGLIALLTVALFAALLVGGNAAGGAVAGLNDLLARPWD